MNASGYINIQCKPTPTIWVVAAAVVPPGGALSADDGSTLTADDGSTLEAD